MSEIELQFQDGRGNYVVPQGYESLAQVMIMAIDQASSGKGTRHSDEEPFEKQEICNGARTCGVGAMIYQVRKKSLEAKRMAEGKIDGDPTRDLLGSMVYNAAAVIAVEEQKKKGR